MPDSLVRPSWLDYTGAAPPSRRTNAKRSNYTSTFIEIALREAGETLYWLELLAEYGSVKPTLLADLRQEADELVAILASTAKTSRNTL